MPLPPDLSAPLTMRDALRVYEALCDHVSTVVSVLYPLYYVGEIEFPNDHLLGNVTFALEPMLDSGGRLTGGGFPVRLMHIADEAQLIESAKQLLVEREQKRLQKQVTHAAEALLRAEALVDARLLRGREHAPELVAARARLAAAEAALKRAT